MPEVVAAARALVEGTTLTSAAIAERLGVSPTSLSRWRKRGRWGRPTDGTGPARPARFRRGRGRPYATDAVSAVRDLVTGTLLSQKTIAAQVGSSQVTVSVWMREHGWGRPTAGPQPLGLARSGPSTGSGPSPGVGTAPCDGGKRFAASRRTGPLEEAGDRRGRPYAIATRREARAMWELTRLPTALIGSRVGVHAVTVARWAKEEAWIRPHGRAGAAQLRGFFGAVVSRGA